MTSSPPGMRFVPLGVGDAFTALHYSSCLAALAEGALLLIDCPHPIQKMLREAGAAAGVRLAADRVEAVVLTHLHADHASGLEGLAYYSYFYLRRRLRLLAHPAVLARLWDGHLAAGMDQLLPAAGGPPRAMRLEDYFEITPLAEDAATRCGPFAIECRPTVHHVPTTALRVRAGGRALGYSADTAFDEELVAWLAAADLVVHETNLGIHTPYARLAALPAELRARMRLIHFPDAFDPTTSTIEALREGHLYEV